MARHLARYGGDPEKSLAAIAGAGCAADLRPDLEKVAGARRDPAVPLPAAATVPGQTATADAEETVASPASTADDDRFRILRLHDQGGLGEVYVVLDGELNREVALKRIREEHADNPQGRARFVVEAEITGNLEHPGVVPVYSLGYGD